MKRGSLSLKDIYPHIAQMWHPTKNGELTADEVPFGSSKIVWWLCRCGFDFEKQIQARTYGNHTSCPICGFKPIPFAKSLGYKRPDVALFWHPEKNGHWLPADITAGSRKEYWWRCSAGHEFQDSVYNLSLKPFCKECKGKKTRRS